MSYFLSGRKGGLRKGGKLSLISVIFIYIYIIIISY